MHLKLEAERLVQRPNYRSWDEYQESKRGVGRDEKEVWEINLNLEN